MKNETMAFLKMLSGTILILISIILIFTVVTGCTLSVTTLHTQGEATDVVDEGQTVTPTVNPNIQIPVPSASSLLK